MQFLKEELRVKILESATVEFYNNGYGKASMREIAKQSGITVGNIYRYFDGKEALFEAVVKEAYDRFYDIVANGVRDELIKVTNSDSFEMLRQELITSLVHCVSEKRIELLILLRGAEGTNYANMKEDFDKVIFDKVMLHFKHSFENVGGNEHVTFIAGVISKSCVEGLVETIIRYDDERKLTESMEMIFEYYFLGFDDRFSKLSKK
ncbi:MAG: TetR/AcrR family transcriptional regulator [Clostridia bacterium]|nr:TetR/AcrR family transcriptional regulator [Clostridia bacterium]